MSHRVPLGPLSKPASGCLWSVIVGAAVLLTFVLIWRIFG